MNSLSFGGYHLAAIRPAVAQAAAAVVNGPAMDKALLQYSEGVFSFQTGAKSGAPTAVAVVGKLQQSDDDGSTDAYADVTDLTLVEVATRTLTDENQIGSIAFRPKGMKRYVRGVVTHGLTAGTSPTIYTSGSFFLYGPERTP